MRPVRIIAAVVFVVLTLLTASAWASSEPVRLQVGPRSVAAGDRVTLSGSVGPESAGLECPGGVQLLSRAFGSTQQFAGVPLVVASVRPNGTFAITSIIPRSRAAGTYSITGRCGAGNFAGATLVVRATTPTPPAALRVSPSSVTAGDRVTVSGSVGGPESVAGAECATGVKLLSRAFESTQEFADVPALGAAVRPDGTFTTTILIPRSRAVGTYSITGRCGGANFAGAILVVRAAPTSPTTTPEPMSPTPTSPPADPPVTQPQVPAPMVAGPATQPTSDLASRWVIPGLAALGSGILAALSVWLLDRRRHPARQNRQGRCYLAQ
jgi:hypothetical protein